MRYLQQFLLTLLIFAVSDWPGFTKPPDPDKNISDSEAIVLQPSRVQELWTFDLPNDLKARIYAASPVFDKIPFVLASTNHDILKFFEYSAGKANTISVSQKHGKEGESVILPLPAIATGFLDTTMGFLIHENDIIANLRIVNIAGMELAKIKDRRHFHYRLAPDGNSVVGLDSGGEHRGFASSTLTYRFFSRTGKPIGEVESIPASGTDSIYTADGTAFLINSRKDGLSSYEPITAKRAWNIPGAFRFFSSSNGVLGRVIAAKVEKRNQAEFYQKGRLLWAVDLNDFGIKEDIRKVAISPNGETIGIASSKDVLILSAKKGAHFERASEAAQLGRFRVKEGFNINSLVVNDRGTVAVGAQSRISGAESGGGMVFVLKEEDGTVLYQKNTQHQRVNAFIPTVRFDPSGRFLLVETLESLTLLSILS